VLRPDLCIGAMGGTSGEVKASFEAFVDRADAFVVAAGRDFGSLKLPPTAKIFRLARFDSISSELTEWMRARLDPPRLAG
jgi:hypothetical protein